MILKNFGLQLWSVKDYTEKDFLGTVEKLTKMGYSSVEFAGFGGIPAEKMSAALKEYGLTSVGSHSGLDLITGDNLKREIEYNVAIGSEYIICPWATMDNCEDVLKLCETLNIAADACKAAGLKFAYHNHDQEFKMDDGKYLFDIMMENTDPAKLVMELDVFWSTYAGVDTLSYIKKCGSRCKLIHMKQIENMETKRNVELPRGMIDFAEIVKTASCAKHFIVEQEDYESDSMASALEDAQYLLK